MHRTMQDNIIFSKSIPKLEKEERERKGKEKNAEECGDDRLSRLSSFGGLEIRG